MAIKYNDTYTGPRFAYGSHHRPFTNMMHGETEWILWSDRPHPDFPNHGVMESAVQLDPERAAELGLIFIQTL